jgi:hypothetical protein
LNLRGRNRQFFFGLAKLVNISQQFPQFLNCLALMRGNRIRVEILLFWAYGPLRGREPPADIFADRNANIFEDHDWVAAYARRPLLEGLAFRVYIAG